MQIKDFFLDLREGPQYAKKNGNVWLLESEAFKDPLKFEFTFDMDDLRAIKSIEQSCMDYYDMILKKENTFNTIVDGIIEKEKMITKSYQKLEELSEKYDLLLQQVKEKENLVKEKELQENKKIGKISKKVNLLIEKLDLPEPQKIYNNQWEEFIVGDDTYYGYKFLLPGGDYVVIEQYEYEPQNEYVGNIDEIKIKQIYIEDGYIPEIQLFGTNALDKPVSKVRLNVLFFQI